MVTHSVRLSDLIDSSVALSWRESIALVQSIAAASTAGGPNESSSGTIADDFEVRSDGTVAPCAAGGRAVTVSELALFLGQLLPADAAERPPAAVKFAIARAVGLVEAPPIVSVPQFTRTLARFEATDRAALVAGVFARWQSAHDAALDRRRAQPSAATFRRWLRDADERLYDASRSESPVASHDDRISSTRVDLLRRFLREADQRTYELQRALAEPPSPPAVPRPGVPRRGGRLHAGFALLTVLAAGGGVLVEHATRSGHPLTARQVEPLSALHARAHPPTGGVHVDRSSQPATGERASAPRRTEQRDVAAPTALPAAPPMRAEGSGGMVAALDVNLRPVFSPSFAEDGSAVFFDANQGAGSALMEARPAAAAGTPARNNDLRVVSIVNDGARNYHPRLSPDNRTLAFDSDRDGERGVYLADRDGRHVRRVSGPGYAAVPSWSPNGRQLAFVKAEPDRPKVWNVWSLDVASGAMHRVTAYRYGQPWGASWFPDGRRICYAHEDALVVRDLTTGQSRSYPSPRRGRLMRTPAVSPTGRSVVFQLYRDGVWLLDLDDGEMRRVLADPSAEEFAWTPDGRQVAFHSRRSGDWGLWFMAATQQ